MYINKNELLNSLTKEDIIRVLKSLGSNYIKDEKGNLIFKTICHNTNTEIADFNLCYYEFKENGEQNKRFYCPADCSELGGFDIFTLIQKVYENRKEKLSFYDSMRYVLDVINGDDNKYYISHDEAEKLQKESRLSKEGKIEMSVYETNKKVLDLFPKLHYKEWISDGVSHEVMDKYNIRFDISSNRIIVPHFDIDGNIIGIKGISLNNDGSDAEGSSFITIEGKSYYHKEDHNLYGLNFNKDNIIKNKQVTIFEDEKSVLLMANGLEKSHAVSVGGKKISDKQFEILKNLGVEQISFAFKKSYKDKKELESYINEQKAAVKKYIGTFKFSLIVDTFNQIEYNDSILSKGTGTFFILSLYPVEF